MKTNPEAYHAFEQLLLTAEQVSRIEAYFEHIAREDDEDQIPPWVRSSELLAALLCSIRTRAGLLARLILEYAQEHISLYRSNEERPAPDRHPPRSGDTPSSN